MKQKLPVFEQRRSFWIASILSLTTLVTACGGGGGGGSSTTEDQSTTTTEPATTTNNGSVSGFGSVIVNGVRYDDTNATVIINGSTAASPNELRLGMIAEVQGTVDSTGVSGTASSITANSFVLGPIATIDPTNNQFTALGVTVTVNNGTLYDGAANLGDFAAGDRVEIFGYADAEGNLTATRVEREAADASPDRIRLTGTASAVTASSFEINGIVIQYDNAAVADLNGSLANGARVQVTGTLGASTATPLTIAATEVRQMATPLANLENQRAELEGVVTAFRSATDFDVNGERVNVTQDAEVDGTLAQGVIVEVEGTVSDGVLLANVVEVKAPEELDDVELAGRTGNLNTQNQTFTLRSGNLTVQWDSTTEFDQSSLPQGSASLANNQNLKIEGRIEGNVVIAERIRVTNANGVAERKAEGRVQDLDSAAQTFTVRNGRLTVQWNESTVFDPDSLPQGALSLANGAEIEAEGRIQGDILVATRIEGEDD